MTTCLLVKTLSISQSLSNNLSCCWPLVYNKATRKMHYQLSTLTINHFLQVSAFCVIFGGIVPIFLNTYFSQSHSFSRNQLAVPVVFAIVFVSSLPLVDYMGFTYGKEMGAVFNWAVETVCNLESKTRNHSIPSVLTLLRWELHKYKNHQLDALGLFAFYMFCFVQASGIIGPAIMVKTKSHPFLIYCKILVGPATFQILEENILFQMLGFVACSYIMESAMLACSNTIMICMCNFHSALIIIRHLRQSNIELVYLIRIYKQFNLCVNLLFEMLKIYLSGYLTLSFFCIIACVNVSINGYWYMPLNVYITITSLGVVLTVYVIVVISLYVLIYENSIHVLRIWRKNIFEGRRKSVYWKRVLASLRPLSFPIGDVGVADTEFKVNYMNGLLVYAANTLILFEDLL